MSAFTAVPRWTSNPVPGVAANEAALRDELLEGLERRAGELQLPLASVLLAAHARVLGALSGESELSIGYAGDAPLRCELRTGPRSWRALMQEADLARRALTPAPAPSETVFDPAADGDLPDGAVLRVGFVPQEGLRLRLRYRTDVLDAASAARIAGYHLAALESIAADPEAAPAGGSLLSAEELRFQLHGLAGPARPLPDCRAHELFEERVRAHPDAVAAVRGDTELTYRELNARANQIAWALLARELRTEEVVAVVSDRTLDWLSAVLGIFKAGGAYLPIEPQFPAERIARMLSRAGCRLVLAQRGRTATLDAALARVSGVQKLAIEAARDEGHPATNPEADVAANHLAYIYFTSGSTGEPKGAMCEHAGMLNHLLAKIDDLRIGAATVVAQTAPQCFDISLWQLLSALLVGGRTLLVEQEAILDPRRFVDVLAEHRVNVMQLVPSYLDVVLACLERHPRELPDLRVVSATGEALKPELAARWLAARPGTRLVNAYGLTETSDDTNHEIMERAPPNGRVPVGRPVNNVRVYVVDEQLAPVPLGAPGEIVFSGVCVGRGYVNDPERTARAFTADPHRDGQRLYRSGDYGRWLPEGKLEFLGRRDSQVKIGGFRIEIGEIENALLHRTGARECAVVVAERAGSDRQLVAFYAAEQPLDAAPLREGLAASLPSYMVPSAFHWRRQLPVTGNGKVDRRALAALAGELATAAKNRGRPATATECSLAVAWADVLGIPRERIARGANFFELGGTSLSALRLAIKLNRAVSLKDLNDCPVLTDLAELIDARTERRPRLAAVK